MAAIIVAYVAIIQGLGLLSGVDDFATTGDVAGGLLLPVGASLVFVYAVVAALGWWRPVLVDDRPVQRWVWAVPAVFVVAILLAIDYGALADRGLAFTAVLLLAALCVGFAEEGMFRGITVTALRGHGWREAKVALWSSIIFGAVHVTNAIATGEKALVQAVAVSFAGYFFYLTRRVSGGLVVPAVIHGLFDFSILSGTAIGDAYPGAVAALLAYLGAAAVVLARRHRIEPA